MKKIGFFIIAMMATTDYLYATKPVVNDSIILYSLEKTVELFYNSYPYHYKTGKPIYWLNVTNVDTINNIWRFAYVSTSRNDSTIVKNFNTDTIIDYGLYLLFIAYNNYLFSDDKHHAVIDSTVFSEEPYAKNKHYLCGTAFCTIKHTGGRKFKLLKLSPHIGRILPAELQIFEFQRINGDYSYFNYDTYPAESNFVPYKGIEKDRAKFEKRLNEARDRNYVQEKFIKHIVTKGHFYIAEQKIKFE
jgi:hypothetical protein